MSSDAGQPARPTGIGSMPLEGHTAFRVWAPNADGVAVTGSFDAWAARHDLEREGGGYWYGEVEGATHGQEYKYVITNGDKAFERIDPRARAVTNSVGNGIIYDRDAFDWQGDGFTSPRTKSSSSTRRTSAPTPDRGSHGDITSLAGKLGYLRDLGINAIELMPVAEFAGDYSWGYNPAQPFAVESSYGGPEMLKAFVREAHRNGIAVIVDVVNNHVGPSDLSLWQFDGASDNGKGGIYSYQDDRSATPWGDTRPDYGREEVRQYCHDNALMWIEEYHIDGLRVDATLYIRTVNGVGSDIPDGWALMQSTDRAIRETYGDKILIAEDLQGDPAVTAADGAGFHAQWDAGFVHPVRAMLATPYDGARSMGALASAVAGQGDPFARVIYTESHDEVANGKVRVPQEIDPADPTGWAAQKRATLGTALVLTSAGIPMLFQRQEFLEDEYFRDDEPLDWGRAEAFRDIVRLARDLIAWSRSTDSEDVAVVVNASTNPQDVTIGLPRAGRWAVRFNSDASTYSALFGGHGTLDVAATEEPLDDHPRGPPSRSGPTPSSSSVPPDHPTIERVGAFGPSWDGSD